MSSKHVKLIEYFETIQGEGPGRGKQVLLVRFKRCNNRCEWCDTYEKMVELKEKAYPLEEIQETLNKGCGLLITGGEPTFGEQYEMTLELLRDLIFPYAFVESNGHALAELISDLRKSNRSSYRKTKFIFSPKIFNDEFDHILRMINYLFRHKNLYLKIVCSEKFRKYEDKFIEKLCELSESKNSKIDKKRIYLMPEGNDITTLTKNAKRVLNLCMTHYLNFSSRDHIIFNFI